MSSQKLKIGIFSKSLNKLRPFEYKILEKILNDKDVELSALIFDGRQKNETLINRLFNLFYSKKLISRIILRTQEIIENLIFKEKYFKTNTELYERINLIKKIYLYPQKKGFLDIFQKKDIEKIKALNLDIIIRTEFNIIRGEILNTPRYGIWSFHHGDNRVNRGGPPCFWEIIEGHKNVGVTLQKLTSELDGGKVIDRGSYNINWSLVVTRRRVYDSSISLLFKNINLLKSNCIKPKDSGLYSKRLYKFPNIIYVLRYIFQFYIQLLKKVIGKLNYHFFGIKYDHWSLAFSTGNFFNTPLYRLKSIKTPKNEFWADPFQVDYNGNKFIFFENYSYKSKLGKISCGVIENDKLIDIKDVLVKSYHLSYPFIYKTENDLFMIPETSENKRLEIYKCTNFPSEWVLYSTGFVGDEIKDCNIHKDDNNELWLFMNKKKFNSDECSDLYIYKIDSLKLNSILPHKLNPVITDSSSARNGGSIFKYNNKVYRPSQINIEGKYGKGLNINEILKLNLTEYEEKISDFCLPNFDKSVNGIHHLDFTEDFFVIDLCKKKLI